MGIITWIVVGLIAGALGKLIYPGSDGHSIFKTTILGIIGGLVGGFLGENVLHTAGVSGFNLSTMAHATVGSILVLIIHHLVAGKKKA